MVLQNYQTFTEITSNMIYIVAFGVGLKCPNKIHLNTQCEGAMAPPDFGRSVNPISTKGADYAHQIILASPDFQTLRWPCIHGCNKIMNLELDHSRATQNSDASNIEGDVCSDILPF